MSPNGDFSLKKLYSEAQNFETIKHHEAGARVEYVCCDLGISYGNFYDWHSKYEGLDANEAKRPQFLQCREKTPVVGISNARPGVL